MSTQVEGRLLDYIQTELLGPGHSVGAEDDLLSGELIDSVGLLRLTAWVEESFDLRIDPSDYVIENFRNVAALTAFIERSRDRA